MYPVRSRRGADRRSRRFVRRYDRGPRLARLGCDGGCLRSPARCDRPRASPGAQTVRKALKTLIIYTLTNVLEGMHEPAEAADERSGTYNAIIATYRVMQRSMAEMLAREGLTQPQFYALRVIAKRGPTPMKTISDELFVTAANVTGIVDRLESKGLIERTAHREDRRATIIGLTLKGRELQDGVAKKYSRFMQRVLQRFTKEEQETLRDLLAKLQEEMSRSRE